MSQFGINLKHACKVLAVSEHLIVLEQMESGYQVKMFLMPETVPQESRIDKPAEMLKKVFVPTRQHQQVSTQPALYCVVPLDSHVTCNDEVFKLTKSLYVQLFSEDHKLAESPVVLVTLPTGHVIAIPIKVSTVSSGWNFVNSQNQDYSVLHMLNEPVVALHPIKLKDDSPGYDGLLINGSQGSLTMIYPGAKTQCACTKTYLPGPIVTAVLCQYKLYHSTYKDVYVTDLERLVASVLTENLDKKKMVEIPNLSSKSLGYGRIVSLVRAGSENAVTVKGLTTDNRTLDMVVKERQINKMQTARQLKDVLVEINNVSQNFEKVRSTITDLDRTISCLHVLSLCAIANGQDLNNETEMPLKSIIQLERQNTGSECRCRIVHCVENKCHMNCNEEWTVVITIYHTSIQDGVQYSHESICSKAVSLAGFNPGEVRMTYIDCADMISHMPCFIHITLAYKSQSLDRTVMVQLQHKTLDVFDFLQPVGNFGKLNHTKIASFSSVVINIARNRPAANLYDDFTHRKSETFFYKSKILLNSDQVKAIEQHIKTTVTATILKALGFDGSDKSIIKATTPRQQHIIIQVQNGGLSIGKQPSEFEIILQSSCLNVLHQMRNAAQERLIFDRREVNTGKLTDGKTNTNADIRKRILKLQDLLPELYALKEQINNTETIDSQIYQLYNYLRKVS